MRIEKAYSFTVKDLEKKTRVDSFLASRIKDLSRSALTGNLCHIYINGKEAKKSDSVVNNDYVELNFACDVFDKVEPQDIKLDVLYEDEAMLVINKEQGMVVHPGAGNINGTVVNALAYRYGQEFIDNMADECDISRPGIVHRLDKDTSGVLIIAKTAQSHANLAKQFQDRGIKKYYYAFCDGIFEKHEGEITGLMTRDNKDRKLFCMSEISGKESRSSYTVVHQYPKAALVKIRIYTGRTHQIRVHMKSINHPVIGDVLYNRRLSNFAGKSLMLHSAEIYIKHPVTNQLMHFEAPLPQRFESLSQELDK